MSEYDAKSICRKHEWTWKADYPEHGIFCVYCGKPNNRLCAERFQDRNDQAAICLSKRKHLGKHTGETLYRGLGNTPIVAYERGDYFPTHGDE